MSMTREEAIVYFESLQKRFEEMRETETSYWGKVHAETTIEATRVALSALRPVSRERVEKVWRGEWIHDINNRYGCSKCMARETMSHKNLKPYCPNCGAAMTDEAVQMVMERLEALYERNDD